MSGYYVYQIVIEDEVRYIGFTNDLKRREKQHNYLLNKGKSKLLYSNLRKLKIDKVELKLLKTFSNRLDAKRYECLLILLDYFKNQKLWQQIPKIKDL